MLCGRADQRAQHLVPGHHVTEGQRQRRNVGVTVEPDEQRVVVGAGTGVELVEQPQPLLSRGQRQHVRADARVDSRTGRAAGETGESFGRTGIEKGTQ